MQLTRLDQFLADSPHQSIQRLHKAEGEGKAAAVQGRWAYPSSSTNGPSKPQSQNMTLGCHLHQPLSAFWLNTRCYCLCPPLPCFKGFSQQPPLSPVFSLTEGLAICCHHSLGTPPNPSSAGCDKSAISVLSAGPLPHPHIPLTI